ncbi:MAG: carboxypeptidase-like regulatory domain-containing protein [Dyadobacter sp.]|uniref:carboxypeptidase-like regulatory domain-containing protein n=1 Tax=Dyadobacter sp. TaxID=1914288 RepID=UPI00326429BA
MKQNPMHSFSKLFSILSSTILFGGLALLLSDCFLKQDRTTIIYGTVTDQNGQPVDSILVIADGVQGFKYETLKKTYSDDEGKYEIVIEPAKRYSAVDTGIPFNTSENSKFMRSYLDYYSKENGVRTGTCCPATIGKKTKYDFQLIPK